MAEDNNKNIEQNNGYLDSEAVKNDSAAAGSGKSGLSRRELRKARLKAEKKAQKEAAKEAKRAKKDTGRKRRTPDEDRVEAAEGTVNAQAEKKTAEPKVEKVFEIEIEKAGEEADEKRAYDSEAYKGPEQKGPEQPKRSEKVQPEPERTRSRNSRKPEPEASGEANAESKRELTKRDIKKNKKQKRKKRRNKVLIIILIIILVIGAAAGTMFAMDKKGMLNVEKITVSGNTYYSDKYIAKTSKVKKGTEIFSIKKNDVEENVKALPYVKSVSVQRQLPHTLAINVVERAPEYAVYAGGYYIYLDKELYMLAKANEANELRIIEGFVPEKIDLGKKFVTEDAENFKLAIKLSKEMDKHGVKIFKISKRDTILRIFLSENIVCEGSYENILANVSRVDAILKSLEDQKIKRATIYFGNNDYIAFSPRIE